MKENKPLTPFNTPPDYFNQLNETVLQRIQYEREKSKKKFKIQLIQWSVAASVLLTIGLSVYNFNTQNTATTISFNTVETSEIESYLETYDISDEDLIETLDISELSLNEEIQYNELLDDIEDELLYQYE
jgi:hypothetical protein